MTPTFISAREAAVSLSISARQVHRLLDDGVLPSVYVGRLRRIPSTAFSRYLAALESEAQADQRRRCGDARISGAA